MVKQFKFLRSENNSFINTPFNQSDVDTMIEYFNLHSDGLLPLTRQELDVDSFIILNSMTGTFVMGSNDPDDNRLKINGEVSFHNGRWLMTIKIEDRRCVDIKINYDIPINHVIFRT